VARSNSPSDFRSNGSEDKDFAVAPKHFRRAIYSLERAAATTAEASAGKPSSTAEAPAATKA
jgi:hypothetical protein